MKEESLVIVEQHATVKSFPSLVHTARQVMENRIRRRSGKQQLITFNNCILNN
jgi:hypothetical protein